MMVDDQREQALRIAWLEMQMAKAQFDMAMEFRKLTRRTWIIALSAAGLVVGAFAIGALSAAIGVWAPPP